MRCQLTWRIKNLGPHPGLQLRVITILYCVILLQGFASFQITALAEKSTRLSIYSSCICPGHLISYECRVFGDGFTLWKGSAFDCRLTNNEIILSHTNFGSGTVRTCNSGKIIGRSLSETNGYYTSRLDVNITTELDGRTVQCVYESGVSSMVTIGSEMISLTQDPFNIPNNISLMVVSPKILRFKWNSVAVNCSTLRYDITSNCGDCPTTTNETYVSCTLNDQLPGDSRCYFSVRSVVCGHIASNWSSLIYATIKVPDAPIITSIVAKYGSDDKRKLINLDIKWTEAALFNIYDEVSGSPLNYTAIFSNNSMGRSSVCGSVSINSSRCLEGVCTASLSSPCYQVGGNITASVSATNILGEGPRSTSYNIATTNQYVDVSFESASRVICEFLGPVVKSQGEQSCTISYGPCQQRLTMTAEGSTSTESQTTVIIDIDTNLKNYCYLINASNGSFVWLIEGSYGNIMTSESPDTSSTVIITTILILPSVCIMFILIIFVLFWTRCLQCHGKSSHRTMQLESLHRPVNSDQENGSDLEMFDDNCESDTDPVDIDYKPIAAHNQTQITAHVILELQDKPWELLKALKCFKDLQINIVAIAFAARNGEYRTRKVYFQCEFPLTDAEKKEILKLPSSNPRIITIDVYCNGLILNIKDIDRDKPTTFIGYKYTRLIRNRPGSLHCLLDEIHTLSKKENAYNRISIADVLLRPSDYANCLIVELRFVCELPRNWKEKFNSGINPDLPQDIVSSL